jgi:SAM-dependent methyltransferase
MLDPMEATPADEFYERCGIVRHVGAMEFWAELSLRCGDDAAAGIAELLERRALGVGVADDVEAFCVDSDRQCATIDAAAPHTWSWLNTLAGVSEVEAVLDLGCGGGVVTCFLAQRHPHARVVGVDSSAVAIATARNLAAQLALTNIEFVAADVDRLDLGSTFDLVVSSAVWAETTDWVHAGRWWSALNELPRRLEPGVVHSALAETAARHLSPNGVYLSLERCRDLAGLGAWIGAQQNVGLNFDTTISDMLTIDGVLSGPERLPLVATHRNTLPGDVSDIVQWRLSVGDPRLDEALLAEMVMSNGPAWSLSEGVVFDARENDDFSAALLLLARGDEGKLYFATTRGVREVLASSPDGGADQFRPLYRRMRDEIGNRRSVVARRAAVDGDLVDILPRTSFTRGGER